MEDFSEGAAWVRGEIVPIGQASIPVTDWGLTHSDAVYDVVPVWDGAFFRLDDYLERFMASMQRLRLKPAEGRAEIRSALIAMVAASGLRRSYVAMVCSRGQPFVPGTRDPRHCANHFFAWCVPYVHVFGADAATRGIRLWVGKDVRRIPDDSVDPRAKNYHWGDFTQGLFEAKDAGFDSVLLLDHAGNVTEGPGYNIFAVKDGRVITPEYGCLEGITRRTAMEIAEDTGHRVEVRTLPLAELQQADELFAVTSGGGPVPVTHLDERVFSNGAEGAATASIRERYWELVRSSHHLIPVAYPQAAE